MKGTDPGGASVYHLIAAEQKPNPYSTPQALCGKSLTHDTFFKEFQPGENAIVLSDPHACTSCLTKRQKIPSRLSLFVYKPLLAPA